MYVFAHTVFSQQCVYYQNPYIENTSIKPVCKVCPNMDRGHYGYS